MPEQQQKTTSAEAGITSSTLHSASHSGQTSSTIAPLKTVFSPLAPSDHLSTIQHNISVIITTERRLSVLRKIRKLGVCSVRSDC
ncbi:hypothetical protein PHYPO_G00077570 [Pangasianodon hypophthalmus]|uniref:Uncharacterized protein n=1 Tax=Pangasianodon hypophthalmus TaxID=310915 RepID=A0A5N5LKX0_PANHP|nr:hypothetical protein PHYPO_G00077570 [Pangasianodon hypophthalmus]